MKLSPYLKLNRLEFFVTEHCSGRCRHCSVGGGRTGGAHHVPQEAAAQAVRALAAHYPMQSVMTFGGEPLLYPEVACAIHRAARDCGIPARQLITNGFFSRDGRRIREVAQLLTEAGVNDVLLSVDAFHQETIPLEIVRTFALALRDCGMERLRLQPAWVVNRDFDCPENAQTRRILDRLSDTGIPVHSGNDIFLAGKALDNLAQYYPPACLDAADCCGSMPYTEPLTEQTALSIAPNGDVMVCAFVIGNITREPMEEIIARYDPEMDEGMRAAAQGVPGLLALAHRRGLTVDLNRCYSVCDLCRMVNGK
ncbi:MAG: radical SAM protein [Clostridiales bacterium]|nr:radical SAM protein [Clostridiales bacterium]